MAKHNQDLKMTGTGSSTGGQYDHVKIIGEYEIYGDLACEHYKCVGTCDVRGSLRIDEAGVTGTLSADGPAWIGKLSLRGTIDVRGGNLEGGELDLKGGATISGNCSAEAFTGKGLFAIGGLLSADTIHFQLSGECRAKEIGGERINIKRASKFGFIDSLAFGFLRGQHAALLADSIEGDDIYLEHTTAAHVRGNRVTIGPNCKIEHVESKEYYRVDPDSTVNLHTSF